MQQTKLTRSGNQDHPYRKRAHPKGLISRRILIKETDLLVSAATDLSEQAKDRVYHYRRHLEDYIKRRPEFLSTILSYPEDPFAPPIVREMIRATRRFAVGPMAAVAGAIAQFVGTDLLDYSEEVLVENGGDIFVKTKRPATVSIFAGSSPLTNRLGLVLQPERMPLGVCTSSGTVGHSLSLGIADAVCVVASSASIADAAATALGNKVTSKSKLASEIESFKGYEDIRGAVVVIGETVASWGEIELMQTNAS
jgi:ApbE superfamily uncharacterized protein (UPF0280 family)